MSHCVCHHGLKTDGASSHAEESAYDVVCGLQIFSRYVKGKQIKEGGWEKPAHFEKMRQYQNIREPKPDEHGVLLYFLNMLQLAYTAG